VGLARSPFTNRIRLTVLPTEDAFGWSVSIAAAKMRLRRRHRSSSRYCARARKAFHRPQDRRRVRAGLPKKAELGCYPVLAHAIQLRAIITRHRSALSNVTANRRIASCQADVLACLSCRNVRAHSDVSTASGRVPARLEASFRSGRPDPVASQRLRPRLGSAVTSRGGCEATYQSGLPAVSGSRVIITRLPRLPAARVCRMFRLRIR